MKKRFMLLRLSVGIQALFLLFLSTGFVGTAHAKAASAPPAVVQKPLAFGQLFTGGKSHHAQDSAWVKLKLAHQIRTVGKSAPTTVATPFVAPIEAAAAVLPVGYTNIISEPPPTGKDAAGRSYTDYYFWYLCGPGATNVVMDYWPTVNNRSIGGHNYSDPYTTTYWNDNNLRAYTMYIADQVYPPWYTSPGEMTYGAYPYGDTTFDDLRDALNWEASGHNTSTWSTYFYAVVGASSLNLNSLRSDVMSDIYYSGRPLVVSVNDAYLPSWNHGTTSHFVTVVGYDNNKGTFTYVETCTPASCGTKGTGWYTISQQQLENGIQDDNGNGGIVW